MRAVASPDALLTEEAYRRIMDPLYARYSLRREGPTTSDRKQIAQLIWRTLRTPLPFLGGTPIGEVTQRRHELEFLLPAPTGLRALPDIRQREHYLTGVIDLVFRHHDKYYLLDWKSNWSPAGDYNRATLEQMMAEHQYHLQYHLYMLALERLLRLRHPDFSYVRDFGGVCYLFVRGLTGTDDPAGIFFDLLPARISRLPGALAGVAADGGRMMATLSMALLHELDVLPRQADQARRHLYAAALGARSLACRLPDRA